MLNENFDNIFKSKLEAHSSTPGSDLWQNIESQLPSPSPNPFWSIGKVISTSVATGLIGIGAFVFIYSSSSKKEANRTSDKNPKSILEKKEHAYIPQEEIIETKKEITSTSTSAVNNNATINKQSIPPKDDEFSIKEFFGSKNKENPTLKNSKADKTHNTPSLKPKVEKIYEAGETVVLQFEFQNVSGISTKKVESWIEFPDWIDASTVETVSYSPGIEVKTTIKEKYNMVIWLAHGNFSGEITSLSSKGMIEYRFKIKEAKTQTEINSIKPEIK
jgi:hypothetical protein